MLKIATIKPPILRSQLEYPTENVTLAYLAAINKATVLTANGPHGLFISTLDDFVDKRFDAVLHVGGLSGTDDYQKVCVGGRVTTHKIYNSYLAGYATAKATADFGVKKYVNGVATLLGSEAVDIGIGTDWATAISISGSAIKAYRADLAIPKVSVTDTSLVSGKYGGSATTSEDSEPQTGTILLGMLKAPTSALAQPISIIEYHVAGSGKTDDPMRPDMPQELIEVSKDQVTPEEWYAIYYTNPKGANGLPLVDRLAVTWGAIDYKGEATMVVAVYSGSSSYLKEDRIQRHLDYAKSKNLLAETVKPDPAYVSDLHKRLTKDRKDMMITENELMYQLLGYEELEVDAVADFYERELINLNRIKNVPEWELNRTLEMWMERARKHGRSNAEAKLKKAKKI